MPPLPIHSVQFTPMSETPSVMPAFLALFYTFGALATYQYAMEYLLKTYPDQGTKSDKILASLVVSAIWFPFWIGCYIFSLFSVMQNSDDEDN